jgi:hypothetical protein
MSSVPADHESPNWLKARIVGLVWRITPDCREVARLTSEERDHALPLPTRTRLGLHRLFCKYCARYADQLDLLHEASHLLSERVEEIGGATLKPTAKDRLKRAVREQTADESWRPRSNQ